VERLDDVFCVHMLNRKMDETQVQEFSDELMSLILDEGCRKLVLNLGPGSPECMYSIFLAKLYTLRRRLAEVGGAMILCDVTDDVISVFAACHLKQFFDFAPDQQTAVAELTGK